MNKIQFIFILSLSLLVSCKVSLVKSQTPSYNLNYELAMSEPYTHYFEVKLHLKNINQIAELKGKSSVLVKMPVWTPGSYLVREFSKNVIDFEVSNNLNSKKIDKNTWEIALNGANELTLTYKVYAYEMSVRTSFLDDSHGYVNGASVFMFFPDLSKSPSLLEINPYSDWGTISTALKPITENVFLVDNYDTLVDSPIEIGNHEVLEFSSMGIPHKVAMYSMKPLDYDKAKIIQDFERMTRAATSVIGENPLDHYLFINHHLPNIGGGLEHLYSSTCQTSPETYQSQKSYIGFFGTLAHEYFHLWNVKRIRPEALGPFDYDRENYTNMLWVAEGFTSYYEEIILKRAGMIDEADVLNAWASGINSIENQPGNKIQAVTESSWDAWIKYYRPNENSVNTTVSYYSKGGVLAGLLNLEILHNTNGNKSLDDVMRLLWNKYYKELKRGYSDEEFQKACEEVAGESLDSFFTNYIWDTKAPDYSKYFNYAGINLINENTNSNTAFLGLVASGTTVNRVLANGSAYNSGINVGDVIISADDKPISGLGDLSSGKNVGDELKITVLRSGVQKDLKMKLNADTRLRYKLEKMDKLTKEQEKIYNFLMNK